MAPKYFMYLRDKILISFKLVPKDGLPPEKLAFSITIGIVSGLFPVFGTTTLISLLLTAVFRQNLLIVQSVQWILAVFQLMLIIPLMKLGAWLLNQPVLHINIEQIKLAFEQGILMGIKSLGVFHFYAIVVWTLLAVPVGVVSYYTFLTIFRTKNRTLKAHEEQHDP